MVAALELELVEGAKVKGLELEGLVWVWVWVDAPALFDLGS